MKVHMTNLLQNYGNRVPDQEIYKDHLHLSELADLYDYESVGCVEHHFDPGYSMCPDNTQFLSYLAARTKNVKLATTAVILPWNDPMRVVEKISMLDTLSNGRAVFGIGRGLARREFEAFGIDMATSRERFDEAAAMVIRGWRTDLWRMTVASTSKRVPLSTRPRWKLSRDAPWVLR